MPSSPSDTNEKDPLATSLVGAWSSLMDLCRKGDAHKIETLASKTLGADHFAAAVETLLESAGIVDEKRKVLAKHGFVHMGHGHADADADASAARKQKLEVATGCVVGLAAVLMSMKRTGHVELVREIGERLGLAPWSLR